MDEKVEHKEGFKDFFVKFYLERPYKNIDLANPLHNLQIKEFLEQLNNYQRTENESEDQARLVRALALYCLKDIYSLRFLVDFINQPETEADSIVNQALLADTRPESSKFYKPKPACRIKEPFCYDRYTHWFADEWYAERRYAIGTYGSVVVQLPSVEHQRRSNRKEQAGRAKEDSGAGPSGGEERPLLQEEKSCEPQGKQGGGPNRFHRLIGWLFAQGALIDGFFFLLLFLSWLLPVLWRVYPLVLLPNIIVWVYLIASRGAHVLKAVVPRLAATAIVGLVPPLITKDLWEFSFVLWEQPWWYGISIVMLLLATWVYLFIETQNRVGKGWLSARRAFHILLRLGNFALFFSWWATTFVYTAKGAHHAAAVKMGVWGWQFVQPQPVTLFFAAVACFIGIFLQVLWHEHPITKPL